MRLIRGLQNLATLAALQHGCALTIGNFDGVHRGHQTILARLQAKARALNVPSVVMLFEPQPREFFAEKQLAASGQNSAENRKNIMPARLMRLRDKLHALATEQVDYVLCVRFDAHFAGLEPAQFIQHWLVEALKVKYVSVGDDFRFGAKRAGDFHTLLQAGNIFGFEVEDSHTHSLAEQRVSSSAIRSALQQDDFALVEALLGRPYSIRGRVAHGNKLGRTIGFPTANLMLNRRVTPIQGVYAVRINTAHGQFCGIANVGNRPTINGTKPLLEVHIFDFGQAIYGETIEVAFLHKVRNEVKFASFDELKAQIERDVASVKDYLGLS